MVARRAGAAARVATLLFVLAGVTAACGARGTAWVEDARHETAWTVNADRPGLAADPKGIGLASLAIRAEAGTIRYEIRLPVTGGGRGGTLIVDISEYAGPGDYAAAVVRGTVEQHGQATWAGRNDAYYALADCRATVEAGESKGRLDCAIGPQPASRGQALNARGKLSASWRIGTLVRDVGPAVEVTWRLGDHYSSSGSATVHLSPTSHHATELYDVPDIRVGGTPSAPETLRMHIMPFAGDGTYTGDAITAMLDSVHGNSSQVVAVDGRRWDDAWTPVFGSCTATLRDGGQSGEITCPGAAPPQELFRGASTTLQASWRVAPS